jgi:enamine deaminase RidA (YjgF/YER057c/UK114 family)
MEMHLINPGQLVKPSGYNHGIKVSGASTLLFLAGQVAWDGAGNLVGEGDFVLQFDKALENILTVVKEAGGQAENIVKLNLYVTDKEKYVSSLKQIGQVYRKHMDKHFPTMTLVEVKSLYEPGTLLEIEGLAVL